METIEKAINKIKNNVLFTKAVAVATFKEWAAYRTHAMISILVGPLYFLVWSSIWTAVYNSGAIIGGLNLEQMLTYYGVNALINYLIMDFADWNLQMLVHSGKYLTFALRPMSHIYFALCQKIGHRILGFLFEFLPVFLIFTFFFKINLVPYDFGLFLISITLGFLMMFFVNYLIGLMAFWLVKTHGIRQIFLLLRNICSGVIFPLMILPKGFQKVMFFLPFQYISYVPTRVFIGTYDLGGISCEIFQIVLIQGVVVILTGVITCIVSKLAVKKFTAVGA